MVNGQCQEQANLTQSGKVTWSDGQKLLPVPESLTGFDGTVFLIWQLQTNFNLNNYYATHIKVFAKINAKGLHLGLWAHNYRHHKGLHIKGCCVLCVFFVQSCDLPNKTALQRSHVYSLKFSLNSSILIYYYYVFH